MPVLVVVPTQIEHDALTAALVDPAALVHTEPFRTPVRQLVRLPIAIAQCGLGKAQAGVQTQHLLDSGAWSLVICAGAAGALATSVKHADVVVGTETIEHDIRKASRPLVPRFAGSPEALSLCRSYRADQGHRLHFGPIASGDEDVLDAGRAQTIREMTGALAVAWEGAGPARACQFSKVPFLELRGIADLANAAGPADFRSHVGQALHHVGGLIAHIAALWPA